MAGTMRITSGKNGRKREEHRKNTVKKTTEKIAEITSDEAALENHITKFHFKFRQN